MTIRRSLAAGSVRSRKDEPGAGLCMPRSSNSRSRVTGYSGGRSRYEVSHDVAVLRSAAKRGARLQTGSLPRGEGAVYPIGVLRTVIWGKCDVREHLTQQMLCEPNAGLVTAGQTRLEGRGSKLVT